MVLSSSTEFTRSAVIQEIPPHYTARDDMMLHCLHSSQSFVPVLSQRHPFHPTHHMTSRSIPILSPIYGYVLPWPIILQFSPPKHCINFSCPLHATCPAHLIFVTWSALFTSHISEHDWCIYSHSRVTPVFL